MTANESKYESCNNQTADALDAYQRAADLDPANVHIKARLQLLRNNGQSTGMSNQHSAPVPQDVHPQLYQAAGVGAPPGPQWGAPGPAQAPQAAGPTPSGSTQDWGRRLAEIQHPQPQPQPPNPYDQREALRPPPPPRQLSPRQDQMMQYREQHRHTPVRRATPPPPLNHIAPSSYTGPQGLPQPPLPAAPTSAPNRITNPNYSGPSSSVSLPPNGGHIPPGPMPPYGRGNSPPPEIRPIAEDRPPSPGPNYSHPHFQHQTNPAQPGGIAAGAPPPTAALAAAEAAAAREREDRPPTGFKRMHEADDDYKMAHKLPANSESRGRLGDHHHRRASPPDRKASPRGRPSPPHVRQPSPPARRRQGSSEARLEDQRRADENYHPSEAAHHPSTLPSMHPQPPPPPPQHEHLPPMVENSRDERREVYEPALRKMEVNEDYDDDDDDEKRGGGSGGRTSPSRNIMNGPSKSEVQE